MPHVFGSSGSVAQEPDQPVGFPLHSPRKGEPPASASAADGVPTQAAGEAFDRIVKLCAARDRSRLELLQRLQREGHPRSACDSALERACACGLVDDARFADALVRGRVRSGKGEVAIRRDLAKHGIDPSQLAGWPEEFGLSHDDQVDRAVAFLSSSPPTAKDAYHAAFRKLQARGYPKSVVAQAVSRWHG